jgi:hypothetical protein
MLGEIVIARYEIMIDADETCKVNVSSLAAGMYRIRINDNESIFYGRFVKQEFNH